MTKTKLSRIVEAFAAAPDKVKTYGVDKMTARFSADGFAQAVGVSPRTVAKWRREDPAGALQRAIEKVGGQAALGRALGMPQKTIHCWVREDIPAPPVREPANGVERAVIAAGGQPAMAALLGVTQQRVSQWCKAGFVSAGRAQEIEMQLGVPRIDLIDPKLRNALGGGGEL